MATCNVLICGLGGLGVEVGERRETGGALSARPRPPMVTATAPPWAVASFACRTLHGTCPGSGARDVWQAELCSWVMQPGLCQTKSSAGSRQLPRRGFLLAQPQSLRLAPLLLPFSLTPRSCTTVGLQHPDTLAPVMSLKAFFLPSETYNPAAKNVILAGVKSITLHDRAEVALRDLAAQFYLSEGDVGRNRAEACRCAGACGSMLCALPCTGLTAVPGMPWHP